VLLELPWNPELLEQRIGRLDRIGQKKTIQIHVPVTSGSPEALLCRWYHEGVGAFERNVPAAGMVFERMRLRLENLAADPNEDDVDKLLEATRDLTTSLSTELFEHRDHLLEYASNDPESARQTIRAIKALDTNGHTEQTLLRLFDHYQIKLEEAGSNRFAMITEYYTDHAFPLPRAKRPVITFDRETACAHDHIEFITIDHPMINGGLELFLSSPHGTTAFALWNDPAVTELLLEAVYLVECIAPAALRIHRFFNAFPLRTVVDHHLTLVTEKYPQPLLEAHLKNGPVDKLVSQKKLIEVTFPKLLDASERYADALVTGLVEGAVEAGQKYYSGERDRLSALKAQGAPVLDEEIHLLAEEEKEVVRHLGTARVRCDAIRLIWRGPVKGDKV
jgi:ATP-dependent helicase HepA